MIDPLISVTSVKALPDFKLRLVFSDGAKGTYDCKSILWGEAFEPLKDPKFFAQVTLVHGSIQGANSPRIKHAWVELPSGVIWEPASNETWDKSAFATVFSPKIDHIYSDSVRNRNFVRFEHWGPWPTEHDDYKMPVTAQLREKVNEVVDLVSRAHAAREIPSSILAQTT